VPLTCLPGWRVAAIGPQGQRPPDRRGGKSLVYITQTDAGQESQTPEEFRAKYGWKD
jgi:hypothetical protein